MTIAEIRTFPTVIDRGPNETRTHESCLRAYQILEKVKYYLNEQVPPHIILELIAEMEEREK